MEWMTKPWPWYVVGPLIGLLVPFLMIVGRRRFGVSSSLKHICAAVVPANIEFLKYDWKKESWNLLLVLGIVIGGFIGSMFFTNPEQIAINAKTAAELESLGITDQRGLVPAQLFSWNRLLSLEGVLMIIVGGFLVGFGTRYADGCTSGHGITGLATFQWTSLVAVIAFFAGGLLVTHVLFPVLF